MIVGVAIAAYARGRREGTWSWPLFVKTLLELSALGAVVGALGVWLGHQMGSEHALLATMLTVVVIVAGVLILGLWVHSKTGHD
jgi:high-affinity Fe2+/Pb2+ permease